MACNVTVTSTATVQTVDVVFAVHTTSNNFDIFYINVPKTTTTWAALVGKKPYRWQYIQNTSIATDSGWSVSANQGAYSSAITKTNSGVLNFKDGSKSGALKLTTGNLTAENIKDTRAFSAPACPTLPTAFTKNYTLSGGYTGGSVKNGYGRWQLQIN